MRFNTNNIIIASLTLFATLVTAAPVSSNNTKTASFLEYGQPTIHVVNQCSSNLKVGYSKDTDYYGEVVDVATGGTHTYTVPINWSGRIWGRANCGGDDNGRCHESGMGSPASLAEFQFLSSGEVYYDISLVDGFNLPMSVAPTMKSGLVSDGNHLCATSSCTTLPPCPAGWETYDEQGNLSGCMSACTKFKTDEYCCTGAYQNSDTCTTNEYTTAFKAACPTAYSYAFDDDTSVFRCESNEYTVTFC